MAKKNIKNAKLKTLALEATMVESQYSIVSMITTAELKVSRYSATERTYDRVEINPGVILMTDLNNANTQIAATISLNKTSGMEGCYINSNLSLAGNLIQRVTPTNIQDMTQNNVIEHIGGGRIGLPNWRLRCGRSAERRAA